MSRLEDIVKGSVVEGLASGEAVRVISTEWYGNTSMEVVFKNNAGGLGSRILYRSDEAEIKVVSDSLPWSFDADGDLMRLASEAYRINLAHIFDPYLAVHTSSIEPLPHQISAVYESMLPRLPLRFILADDPGAGKTIMTGLLLKELMIRGDLKRCLIVSPGSLSEQWQDELYNKFHLYFDILTNDRIESSVTGNVFKETNLCIARLDKLARSEVLQEKLKAVEWDLIVFDEAHKLSATIWNGEIKYTARFKLGRLLSGQTRHLLLLTATPHNGKSQDFQLFLSLIDQDRFEGVTRSSNQSIDTKDIMRRLVKEKLLRFDGTPLFPERIAYTVNYDLSDGEAKLYSSVTDYVRDEFNRAERLEEGHKTTVGFALTILQRRLASSPEAIYQSLRRRRERLENRLNEEKLGRRADTKNITIKFDDDYDADDYTAAEEEETDEKVADQASASTSIQELEAEIQILSKLERLANEVRMSGADRKWDELSKLLQENEKMFARDGQREKLIIFTEHRDTLRYLAGRIRSLLGSDEAVVTIHGGMLRDDRRKVEVLFREDKDVRVLIATDAAGEGINLQRSHLMVNYDLPWNPNRLEQRFGRIHRIGQTEVCYLWNLVASETREGQVFQRLFEKLDEEREALGGKVFDILGKVSFNNKPLRELLIEAIKYGSDPNTKKKLLEAVDDSLDIDKLRKLIEENALTDDTMDISRVMRIRAEMERIEAHKLQPHFIEAFFIEAFRKVGGKIHKREHNRYEITFVPFDIKNRDIQIGTGEPVTNKYERVCFDKADSNVPGLVPATLICPGHPLLEATSDLIREKFRSVMKQGTIFIDENDFGTEPRMLFYIEDSIQDGVMLQSGGNRIISKNVHFVELKEDGSAVNAGYAPYLDYRALRESETDAVREYIDSCDWLKRNVEGLAKSYAVTNIIPKHFEEVRERKIRQIEKIRKAVKSRLTQEIQYWDYRASELANKEKAGKGGGKLNSENARRKAEELESRMHRRFAELEKEKAISALPPVIVGGAVVIPKGLLARLTGDGSATTVSTAGRQAVEYAAMKAVMDIERSLGFMPRDVSRENVGYDIESEIPEDRRRNGGCLRFIEVKGRAKGADTVTITRNEILTAMNKPDEYILALVEVDGDRTKTVYLRHRFSSRPEFSETCKTFNIRDLISDSEILLER